MRTLTRSIVALALPVTVALTALPAQAAQITVKDAKGDVRVAGLADAENQKKLRKAPKNKKVKDHDIVRTKFAHTRKRLVVQTKFRSLKGEKIVQVSTLGIKTPKQTFAYQWVRSEVAGEQSTTSILTRAKGGKQVKCKVRVANNVKKAVRTIKIPRTCLGKPKWVRVTSNATTGTMENLRIDDALGKGLGKATKKIAAG